MRIQTVIVRTVGIVHRVYQDHGSVESILGFVFPYIVDEFLCRMVLRMLGSHPVHAGNEPLSGIDKVVTQFAEYVGTELVVVLGKAVSSSKYWSLVSPNFSSSASIPCISRVRESSVT